MPFDVPLELATAALGALGGMGGAWLRGKLRRPPEWQVILSSYRRTLADYDTELVTLRRERRELAHAVHECERKHAHAEREIEELRQELAELRRHLRAEAPTQPSPLASPEAS